MVGWEDGEVFHNTRPLLLSVPVVSKTLGINALPGLLFLARVNNLLPAAADQAKIRKADRKRELPIMENFLKDKDIWILGSMCLVATFLWRRLWNLLWVKKRRRTPLPGEQVIQRQRSAHLRYLLSGESSPACSLCMNEYQ